MTASLKKFRVTQFRSIADSGWIEVDEVTALIRHERVWQDEPIDRFVEAEAR